MGEPTLITYPKGRPAEIRVFRRYRELLDFVARHKIKTYTILRAKRVEQGS